MKKLLYILILIASSAAFSQNNPLFKTEVQIPNSKIISGTGTSKKNAQQNAAAKLLNTLRIL